MVVSDRVGGEARLGGVGGAQVRSAVGLAAIHRGHPLVADLNGVVRDGDCPPVEIATTVLVSFPDARADDR
ncbi:hypothetical protein [Mycobacterium leprae]|uniref:hypothetical protein n=1 Tax=Mycobacterium leprae TaxID=1769 RepID=UPI0003008F28|nr:hypothetical protein [Mycobacterium leprae]